MSVQLPKDPYARDERCPNPFCIRSTERECSISSHLKHLTIITLLNARNLAKPKLFPSSFDIHFSSPIYKNIGLGNTTHEKRLILDRKGCHFWFNCLISSHTKREIMRAVFFSSKWNSRSFPLNSTTIGVLFRGLNCCCRLSTDSTFVCAHCCVYLWLIILFRISVNQSPSSSSSFFGYCLQTAAAAVTVAQMRHKRPDPKLILVRMCWRNLFVCAFDYSKAIIKHQSVHWNPNKFRAANKTATHNRKKYERPRRREREKERGEKLDEKRTKSTALAIPAHPIVHTNNLYSSRNKVDKFDYAQCIEMVICSASASSSCPKTSDTNITMFKVGTRAREQRRRWTNNAQHWLWW